MRYKHGAFVSVPFINTKADGDTERCWAHLDFVGDVDRRRIKRAIKKWVYTALSRKLGREELALLMRKVKDKAADGTWR